MSATRTPGRWAIHSVDGSQYFILANDNSIVCSMDEGHRLANARLVAAAPEMLEGLKAGAQAVEVMMRLLDKTLPTWRAGYTFAEVHRGMLEAIKKAEGGAE